MQGPTPEGDLEVPEEKKVEPEMSVETAAPAAEPVKETSVIPPAPAAHPPAAVTAEKPEEKTGAKLAPKPAPLSPPPEEAPKVGIHRPKEPRLAKKKEEVRFDSRDRQGLRDIDNEAWRKRRAHKPKRIFQEEIVRPKNLSVRLPITIKDLAQEMKLKASQLIAKLLMQEDDAHSQRLSR